MARINVEDTIWRDDRFDQLKTLLGGKAHAIGWLVVAWDLSHLWFGKTPTHLIPIEEWRKAKMPDALMETGFAEERDGGVYVRGTNDHCRYILDRKEAGRKGGLKTQENSASKSKQTKQVQPSSSSLPLKEENNTCALGDSGGEIRAETVLETRGSRRARGPHPFAREIEEAYALYPKRLGGHNKADGLRRLQAQITTSDAMARLLRAIRAYAAQVRQAGLENTAKVKMFATFSSPDVWPEFAELQVAKPARSVDEILAEERAEEARRREIRGVS